MCLKPNKCLIYQPLKMTPTGPVFDYSRKKITRIVDQSFTSAFGSSESPSDYLTPVKIKDREGIPVLATLIRQTSVPCGDCPECADSFCKDWRNRLTLEAYTRLIEKKDLPNAYFLTLTYDEEHVDKKGYLNYDHLQKFYRDFCSYHSHKFGITPRYYFCGEYGSKSGRPHYHGIIFTLMSPSEIDSYIRSHWFFGFYKCEALLLEHLNYVASYSLKKSVLLRSEKRQLKKEGIPFERSFKSRGIGYEYCQDHYKDILSHGFRVSLVFPSEFGFQITKPSFAVGRYFIRSLEKTLDFDSLLSVKTFYDSFYYTYSAVQKQRIYSTFSTFEHYFSVKSSSLQDKISKMRRDII